MRQYVYESSVVGLKEWPSGTLRLDGIDVTEDPEAADLFVVPGSLALFRNPNDLYRLPYFKGREASHVLFDVSDYETKYHQPSMFLRCNLRQWNLEADPGSIQFAWPVEDYSDCIPVPSGGFLHDLSFQGWVTSHESRRRSVDSCLASGLKCDIATYNDFTGYCFHEPEGIRRRAEFRRSMRESRICLCPESIDSVFPYRYFETLSAGRVPLLVGSDFVYPWADEIPYSSFSIVCPRDRADTADQVAAEFLKSHTDEQIIEMGTMARYWWEQLLDSRKWPKLHSYAIQKKLGAECPTAA